MSESPPPEPTLREIERAWLRPRASNGPRNALGNEIWFEDARSRYMPSTAMGMYLYFAFIVLGSLWAGLIGLLAQFGVLRGAWIVSLAAPPLIVSAILFWRFAHRHSPSARPRRKPAQR